VVKQISFQSFSEGRRRQNAKTKSMTADKLVSQSEFYYCLQRATLWMQFWTRAPQHTVTIFQLVRNSQAFTFHY